MDVWSYNITGAGTNENNPTDINNGGRLRAVTPVVNAIAAGHRPVRHRAAGGLPVPVHLPGAAPRDSRLHGLLARDQVPAQVRGLQELRGPIAPKLHGDLIAVPSSYGPSQAHPYDFDPATDPAAPAGEGLTCLSFTKLTRFTVACSTHISGNNEQRTYKTYRMRVDEIEPWGRASATASSSRVTSTPSPTRSR